MGFDIVRGVITQPEQTRLITTKVKEYIEVSKDNGILYLGYPLTASSENKITIDALLITEKHGMIAFIYENKNFTGEQLRDEQDELYYHLDFYLKKYGSLRNGRNLAFATIIITVLASDNYKSSHDESYYYFINIDSIVPTIKQLAPFKKEYYRSLCEALQKVTNIRPQKKRANVKSDNSHGFVIKEIEKEIANLDE